ncbi:MAG: S8 family serine peptidase [Verrucomicrobiota bacterium JB023]|nr:S8 family serine peptidase [Verrucomicrobiota bacterium JB023]
MTTLRTLLTTFALLHASLPAVDVPMESLQGTGIWISPLPKKLDDREAPLRVTVWFDKQLLGDGEGYQRRAEEFDQTGRRELRQAVIAALKEQSEESYLAAKDDLDHLQERGVLSELQRHWIINGFSCTMRYEDVFALARIPHIRKVFLRPPPRLRRGELPEAPEIPALPPLETPDQENFPWYISKLQADRVWREFGVAGQGTLNVIHDKNFIITDHLARSVYRNPGEIEGNGIDDDGNGYIDDVHGYNFDQGQAALYTRPFDGDPKKRTILHGTSCANIVSGTGDGKGSKQCGVAPLSRWAGLINQGGIEQSVEWAIEQGADTYSMSFSRRHFGEYRSHWRKVMEHGNFCGLFFVSGAGNIARHEEFPYLMNIPQSIPNAVFAAAGVQQDLSKTDFSCVGPVEWDLEHYQDGIVQKPEVCAFNAAVPGQFPDGSMHEGLLYGNSYAGPMFCGTIALMLSADPDLLPWDLKEIITSTASDVGPAGVDYETGHGLINCYEAVKEVLHRKALRQSGE